MASPPKAQPIAPPTISHLKSQGVTGARVCCSNIWCGYRTVVAFAELELADQTLFLEIKRHRRWTCQRCGRPDVSVMPDWRDPKDVHADRKR